VAKLSNDEAQRLSGEHLKHEIEMLFLAGDLLLARPPVKTVRENTIKNALLEVFVVHLRALVDFLDDVGSRPDDVIAADFVADSAAWVATRPPLPAILRDASGHRANKEVAHITSGRIYGAPPEKGWDVASLRDAIADRLGLFIAYADPSRLAQRFVDVFQALVAHHVDLNAACPETVPPNVMASTSQRVVVTTTSTVAPIILAARTSVTTP
jgi:hypothetical protein